MESLNREIYEETSIKLDPYKVIPITTVYIQKPACSFTYHMYFYRFTTQPMITLSDEHEDLCWHNLESTKVLLLLEGSEETMKIFQSEAKKLDLL